MITVQSISSDVKQGTASFVLKGVNPSMANAMRRSVLEDVPTLAIEDVEIRKNSSIMYDEMIAHRLGLTPLTTDLKGYTLAPEGTSVEDMGASSKIALTLKIEGPGTVYASDLKCKDTKIKPAHPGMIIVKLLKGQKLELIATAVMGTGKEHSKWSPGHVYYREKLEMKGTAKDPQAIVDATPPGVFEIKNGKLVLNEQKLLEFDLAGSVEAASNGEVTLNPTGDYIFYVESFGQLSCKEMMEQAATVFEKQLKDFEKIVK